MATKPKTKVKATTGQDDAIALDYLHSVAIAEVRRRYPGTEPGPALIRRTSAGLHYYFSACDLGIMLQVSIAPDEPSSSGVLASDPYLQTAEAEQETST